MKFLHNPILLFLTFTYFSCSHKIDSKDLIERFYKNQGELIDLVAILKRDTLTYNSGNILQKDTFDILTARFFEKLGLRRVWVFSWSCIEERQFDFTTNWSNQLPIHLYYNTCDTTETVKGFYRKDQNGNEFWGLGNNWALWSERKLLEGKQ